MDDSYEVKNHSFLLRIWNEEHDVGKLTWRGHITHVSDGTRYYVESLEDINAFVKQYLVEMGVNLSSSDSNG